MAKQKTTHQGNKTANQTHHHTTAINTKVSSRGRVFEGFVTKKFHTRVVIEFERTVFVHKYERFYKKKTKLHARIPAGMDINVGDYIKIRECRPLSKIIHFIVIEKVKSANQEAKQ